MLFLHYNKTHVKNQAKSAKLRHFQGTKCMQKLCVVTTCNREIKINFPKKYLTIFLSALSPKTVSFENFRNLRNQLFSESCPMKLRFINPLTTKLFDKTIQTGWTKPLL